MAGQHGVRNRQHTTREVMPRVTAEMAAGLPTLRGGPACGPIWRLFDASHHALQRRDVRRQVEALCVRCPLKDGCKQRPLDQWRGKSWV